jgi:predicted transposase YbfD/YdcC
VVPEKSYEIVAFRRCLTLLATEDAIVSIRAIGCRRDIADKIVAQKGRLRPLPQRTTGIFRIGVPATYDSPLIINTTWRP